MLHAVFRVSSSLFLLLGLALFSTSHATDFYLDATDGKDSNPGTRADAPWNSLEKINATPLRPGDRVFFKAGSRWIGQLRPRPVPRTPADSDTLVRIGRYGDGPLPRIDAQGKFLSALFVENFGFLEIADLEITNLGETTAAGRTGVKLSANGIGKMPRIYLRRLYVHDVNGDMRKSHEGCGIFFTNSQHNDSHFDGLLIENCRVERTDRNGICQLGVGKTRSRNVIIRNNTLNDIGGDGIKLWGTNGGVIERNVVRKARARCNETEAAAGIWPFACDDTLIQFNEVSDTKGTLDGQGYDSDYLCRRSIFQYNSSFRNEGGFMLICSPGKAYNDGTIIRYNISVHDGLNSARVFHFGGGSSNTHIYHNTIIIGAHQNLPMIKGGEWNGGIPKNARFSNNLFIVEPGGNASYSFGPSRGFTFEGNVFVGSHHGLPANIQTGSPMPPLVGPLKPVEGFEALKAFRPSQISGFPRGILLTLTGEKDFFGNPMPTSHPPLTGAAQR